MQKFDVIIIGTGQAGPPIATRCSSEGLKVAIIEKNKFGGTCVNDGCTPTKAWVASARAAYVARNSTDLGVVVSGTVSVDMKKVKARKDKLVSTSSQGLEDRLKDDKNITVFHGHARFVENHVISVNGAELTAKKIFINVGGRSRTPIEYENVKYLTNTEILQLEEVPEHLVIIGGSYIGLEFGQLFRRFGSKVTIIERNERLINREDTDVSDEILHILKEEGIEFELSSNCISGQMNNGKPEVTVDCDGKENKVTGSHLLLAIGRVPNTDDLGLEHTDIKTDDRGYIQVNDQLETDIDGVWAVGDCNGEGAFTHTAYHDHEVVMANLFDQDERRISERILCYGLFIDPALGRIGMTEREVREKGIDALITKRPMTKVARAKEKGETHGFMKIMVDAKSEKILGATILGTNGDEIVHSLLDVMYADKSYKTIQRAVHIHPTVSELIPTALGELEKLGEQD